VSVTSLEQARSDVGSVIESLKQIINRLTPEVVVPRCLVALRRPRDQVLCIELESSRLQDSRGIDHNKIWAAVNNRVLEPNPLAVFLLEQDTQLSRSSTTSNDNDDNDNDDNDNDDNDNDDELQFDEEQSSVTLLVHWNFGNDDYESNYSVKYRIPRMAEPWLRELCTGADTKHSLKRAVQLCGNGQTNNGQEAITKLIKSVLYVFVWNELLVACSSNKA
jgi:hypothetical protein